MSIRFDQFSASLPAGTFLGLIGHGPKSGIAELLETAPAGALVCPNLSALDLPTRLAWLNQARQQQRAQGLVVAASGDAEVFRHLADEVWWLEDQKLMRQGDPGEVIGAYLSSVYPRKAEFAPSLRRGDGRATIENLRVLDEAGEEATLISSGRMMTVEVTVRYQAAVSKPVVGIMIRTRIGFEVYGTNTELEKVTVGPVEAGARRRIRFQMECRLCPQSYTITAASHDPDGVWHEWVEDAISFTVSDTRYTAGVANLKAQVTAD
jgi:lipopolysaccharide transport system ATP-binding protein